MWGSGSVEAARLNARVWSVPVGCVLAGPLASRPRSTAGLQRTVPVWQLLKPFKAPTPARWQRRDLSSQAYANETPTPSRTRCVGVGGENHVRPPARRRRDSQGTVTHTVIAAPGGARSKQWSGGMDQGDQATTGAMGVFVSAIIGALAFLLWEHVGLTPLAGRETAERRSRAI